MASSAALLASSLAFSAAPALAQERGENPAIQYKDKLASDSTAPVGIQLVLAMDTSFSMTNEEFGIELQATAQALNSQVVRSIIKYKAGAQSMAVAVVDFDGEAQMRIGWVDIRGAEINDKPYQPDLPGESSAAPDKLDALAHEIAALPRRGNGSTEFEPMMNLSKDMYLKSPWQVTERRILDVFSDGRESGYEKERDALINMGVTINAFAICNEEPNLDELYRDGDKEHNSTPLITTKHVPGPDGIYSQPGRVWAVARNLKASDNTQPGLKAFFGEVTRGMRQKISVEVAGLEEYRRVLAMLDLKPDFPIPAVSLAKPG